LLAGRFAEHLTNLFDHLITLVHNIVSKKPTKSYFGRNKIVEQDKLINPFTNQEVEILPNIE